MQRNHLVFLVVLTSLIPQCLLANAGTALMYLPFIQLVIGNVLLGVIEGIIITAVCKTKWIRTLLIMIAGNYASWFIGNGMIYLFQNKFIDVAFNLNGVFALWIFSMILLYVLTVVVELPFFRWSFRKPDRSWPRALKLSLIVNLCTYALMMFVYLSVSKYSFFTDIKMDRSLLNGKTEYELFYTHRGAIYKGVLAPDFVAEKVYDIPDSITSYGFILQTDAVTNEVDLVLQQYISYRAFGILWAQKCFLAHDDPAYHTRDYPYGGINGEDSDFRDPSNRDWKALGYWNGHNGLTIWREDTIQHYGFEVPWMDWHVGKIDILNDAELVLVINGRIILFNKDTRKVALITRGEKFFIRKIR